jgi:hypothetical protein
VSEVGSIGRSSSSMFMRSPPFVQRRRRAVIESLRSA